MPVPSDTYKPYKRYLAPPVTRPASERIKRILPDYRITHLLGSGGFANVYGGTDADGWAVAVKVPQFNMEETLDLSVVEKFATEAEIWEKLDHENIVELYDSDERPFPHLVMELMDGGSLKSLMKNHRLAVGEAVQIMLQVLNGLSYAHRMATVHRDIKPENILFTSEGVAKITDWGIGKYMASASLTKTVGTKGTLAYSAPEQFDKKKFGKVDWQTDIFQLGIVFYEMLTGKNPFEGQGMAEVMGNVLTYQPDPPSSHNPDVPEELDRIIMGALEKDKNNRWRTDVMLYHLKESVRKRPAPKKEPVSYQEPDREGIPPQAPPTPEPRPQPTRPPRKQSGPAQATPKEEQPETVFYMDSANLPSKTLSINKRKKIAKKAKVGISLEMSGLVMWVFGTVTAWVLGGVSGESGEVFCFFFLFTLALGFLLISVGLVIQNTMAKVFHNYPLTIIGTVGIVAGLIIIISSVFAPSSAIVGGLIGGTIFFISLPLPLLKMGAKLPAIAGMAIGLISLLVALIRLVGLGLAVADVQLVLMGGSALGFGLYILACIMAIRWTQRQCNLHQK